jgi:hypothetical protein
MNQETNMCIYIPLSQGKQTLVDKQDHEWLSQWKWSYAQGYAVRSIGPVNARRQVRMHIALMSPPDGMEVDHIDLDPLNNTRANLRICTHQQNTFNRRLHRDSTSGYKGVSWDARRNKWDSYIIVNGVMIHLGLHADVRKAAEAYDAAATLHFGKFARLNFPEAS